MRSAAPDSQESGLQDHRKSFNHMPTALKHSGQAAAWLERQRRFMDEHLMAWVPAHCERLAGKAGTPFYAAVATVVGRACRIDREDIAGLINLERAPVASEHAG